MSIGDVLALLVARRRLVMLCFIVPVILATAYAVLRDDTYEFRSVYQLAEGYLKESEAEVAPLETGESVISKSKSLFLPQAVRSAAKDSASALSNLDVELTAPEDTKIITLTTVDVSEKQKGIARLHNALLKLIASSQAETLQGIESRVKSRLASAKANYESLKNSESRNAAELATRYIELMADYDNRLVALKDGKILSVAEPSSKPVGMSSIMWILAGVMLGCVFALLGPLLVEAMALVQRTYRHIHAEPAADKREDAERERTE